MENKDIKSLPFEKLMEWARENLDGITTKNYLIEYVIEKIKSNDFNVALHILNAIYDNPSETDFYRYYYSMGTLETPTPITEYADIEDLI